MNNQFEIITYKGHENQRLYNSDCNPNFIAQNEIYYLMLNTLKNDYDIYHIFTRPAHKSEISPIDMEYISSDVTSNYFDYTHNFSNETLKIKNLQVHDLNLLYDLAISTDKIGFLFTIPKLNPTYCVDIIIAVKKNFSITSLFRLKFKLIKFFIVKQYKEKDLSLKLVQDIYDFGNFKFKNSVIKWEDSAKISEKCSDVNYIPELKRFYELKKLRSDYVFSDDYKNKKNNDKNQRSSPYDLEIDQLENIIDFKSHILYDMKLQKKLIFNKLCHIFLTFHEIIDRKAAFLFKSLYIYDACFSNQIFENDSSLEGIHLAEFLEMPNEKIITIDGVTHEFAEENLYCIFKSICYWSRKH